MSRESVRLKPNRNLSTYTPTLPSAGKANLTAADREEYAALAKIRLRVSGLVELDDTASEKDLIENLDAAKIEQALLLSRPQESSLQLNLLSHVSIRIRGYTSALLAKRGQVGVEEEELDGSPPPSPPTRRSLLPSTPVTKEDDDDDDKVRKEEEDDTISELEISAGIEQTKGMRRTTASDVMKEFCRVDKWGKIVRPAEMKKDQEGTEPSEKEKKKKARQVHRVRKSMDGNQ